MSEQITKPTPIQTSIEIDVHSVIDSWLIRTVNNSLARKDDIKNDKSKAVLDFFDFCRKSAEQVLPSDVEEWLRHLNSQKLADGTVYNKISALAQFYEFLREDGNLKFIIPINPAKVSLPKAPKPFQSESTKALTREELAKLLEVVEKRALDKTPVHLRDLAILQFYIVTGRRRTEVINLRADSIRISGDRFFIKSKVKGGFFINFELDDLDTQKAIFEYLEVTGRSHIIGTDEPLWLRHDKGAASAQTLALTPNGFVKRIRMYAVEAGIENFHIHRLRHTYAKMVSEVSQSMADTQEALGHSNIKTTQIYVQRLSVKKDKFSKSIRNILKNDKKAEYKD